MQKKKKKLSLIAAFSVSSLIKCGMKCYHCFFKGLILCCLKSPQTMSSFINECVRHGLSITSNFLSE